MRARSIPSLFAPLPNRTFCVGAGFGRANHWTAPALLLASGDANVVGLRSGTTDQVNYRGVW